MNVNVHLPSSPEYCLLWFWGEWWPVCMTKTEWSGWVQALGAVAAIGAGAYAVWWQVRKSRITTNELHRLEEVRVLRLIAIANLDCIKALKLAILQIGAPTGLVRGTLNGFESHCDVLASVPLLQIPDHWVAMSRARAVQEKDRLRKKVEMLDFDNGRTAIDRSLREFLECERVLGAALAERHASLPYSRVEIGNDTVLHEAPKTFETK